MPKLPFPHASSPTVGDVHSTEPIACQRATITINGLRPLAVTKRQAIAALGSPKVVQRMLWCARHQPHDPWLRLARPGRAGTECLIDTESLESAYRRLLCGEHPPLMPSERGPRHGHN
jgi:hypothetical protein